MKFYSETTFYSEVVRKGGKVQLKNQDGKNIVVEESYLDLLNSADRFEKEEKVTQTVLSEIVKSNPNIAMSILFIKQSKPKSKKAYSQELEERTEKVKQEFLERGAVAIKNALTNPVLDYIPGEERLIKGYPTGTIAANGKYTFCDAEDGYMPKDCIDPQTIMYIVVNNVKYIRK